MKEYNHDLIQVLWVEDDPDVINTYPLKAENFDLELVSFTCWDDAKVALENDFDRWSAIILDAKCKYHRDSADNAVEFLREALVDIARICDAKKRVIPWYVLTGGSETEVSDSINDKRLAWDADWTDSKNKKYYSKNVDNEDLYHRIRYHAKKSPRIQIHEMYRNVFDAIEECGIDDKGYNAMEDLLVPIHFPDTITNKDYNGKYEKAREVLEYLFRSMSSYGMLPDWGKQVNLQWSSCILAGMNATRKAKNGEDIVVIESKKQALPPVIRRIMKEMTLIIPAFCHSDTEEEGEIKKEEYLESVDNSVFLLRSFTYQLCDVILWYKNYLKDHNDKSDNQKAWEILAPQFLNMKKNGSK